jgi:peroxiredoxin
MTAGCSLEARGLTGALDEFKKRGVQVFGVSVQDVNSKKQFCDKEGIKYPMLADVKRTFHTVTEYSATMGWRVASRSSRTRRHHRCG